ncbi:MAG: PRC-barrel domain protein [Firmicutes bacterium]|nr:PRC-barrel domain protein [Bacillota bacterium]
MKKSVDIIGQPIISITEGKELGSVKDLLINHSNGTIAALVIADEKWYLGAKLVPFNTVTGLGESAVTINNSNDIVTITGGSEFEKLFEAGIKIIGTKVLTKGGKIQGKVNEILIDNSGKIESCEMEKPDGEVILLPAQNVVTFGKEVVIVADSDEVVSNTAVAQPVETVTAQPEPIAEPTPAPVVEVVEEIPVQQKEAEAPTAKEENQAKEQQADDSAKKFDDKHRKFLLGKKASRRIETDNGMLIVEQGGDITEEVLQKAKLAGKFVELSMNIQ